MTNDVQYKLRMPKGLHLLVQKSCTQAQRSINGEIVYRLEQSFRAHEAERPAGLVAKHNQAIGDLAVKLDALKDFTGGGMIHAPSRRLGRSRHDSESADSVARNGDTLLDYFRQFPGWEGFLGAMGEAFMREYSARTDEQVGHSAGMMAALSVPLAPRLNNVLSSEQRKGSMHVTVTTADFVMRQLTVSVTGEMPCTDGRYLLIPEATDGQ
jgi:hypothetical protein